MPEVPTPAPTARPEAGTAGRRGPDAADPAPPVPSFGQALAWWLRLGCISFGGPAGQIALMHTELVERRRWISERRFLHALNYCMLLPGPEAQQLATYIGWLMHRTPGALVAGGLFVLPSFFLLAALSWGYLAHGDLPAVAAVLWGVKPAVVALVAAAAWRIGRRVLRRPLAWAIAVAALAGIALLGLPFPLIVAAAAATGWIASRRWPHALAAAGGGHGGGTAAAPHRPAIIDDDTPAPPHARWNTRHALRLCAAFGAIWLAAWGALALAFGASSTLAQMGGFFTRAALLTFGGAYAVLPYVQQAAVDHHGWLTAGQMIDGLALGESTPGPLIMVVAFVGFVGGWTKAVFGPEALLAAGLAGAAVATFFTFLPSFFFILLGAPFVETTHGRLGFAAPLAAITAAVVGVIANLALYFAGHVFWPGGWGAGPDVPAALLAVAALAALLRGVGVLPVIGACAAAGLLRAALT